MFIYHNYALIHIIFFNHEQMLQMILKGCYLGFVHVAIIYYADLIVRNMCYWLFQVLAIILYISRLYTLLYCVV